MAGMQVSGNSLALNGEPFYPVGWNSVAALYLAAGAAPYTYRNAISGAAVPYPGYPAYTAAYEQFRYGDTCAALQAWGTNTVRFQVHQNVLTSSYASSYLSQIQGLVTIAEAAGFAVILCPNNNLPEPGGLRTGPYSHHISLKSLQLSNPVGTSWEYPAQPWNSVTSAQNTESAWITLATQFKTDPLVMFELFNEPKDTDWTGTLAPDYQTLITAIRGAGADNVIITEGMYPLYGSSGSGAFANINPRQLLTDTGSGRGIAYSVHKYTAMGTADDWYRYWGWVTAYAPVLFTEWYNTKVQVSSSTFLSYNQSKSIGVIGWVFDNIGNTGEMVNQEIDTSDFTQPWTWTPTSTGLEVQDWMRALSD